MSNWDLMMPGMGLSAIGLAGVVVSYSGIAHTFVDGMHALTGLTMFFGLIFLSAGILEGGVSTSNRAKATTLVILSITLSFGLYAFTLNTITSLPIFAGILISIAIPSIIIAYVSMKIPEYTKPISIIFTLAISVGIITFVVFNSQYSNMINIAEENDLTTTTTETDLEDANVIEVSILLNSSEQNNPDYEPDIAKTKLGDIIRWTNNDTVSHTVTSSSDFGETFDSGLMNADDEFILHTSDIGTGQYEYMCIVHPWMVSSIVIE